MELRQIEHFLAVAQSLSFTAAAQEVHIVQSALSTSIQKLEADLRAPPFERTTRRVALTAAGEALLPLAHRIVAEATAARGAVSSVSGLCDGRVSIGTVQAMTVADLPAELAEFQARHPGVRIHVRDGTGPELANAVAQGELDLSHLPEDGRLPDDLVSHAQWSQELVLLCHPGHRLEGRGTITLTDLHDERFVDLTGSGLRPTLCRRFTEAGVRHNRVCEATDPQLLVDLVGAGLGIAVVPLPVATRSGLAFVRIEHPVLTRVIHLAGRAPGFTNPAAGARVHHLLSRRPAPALSTAGSPRT